MTRVLNAVSDAALLRSTLLRSQTISGNGGTINTEEARKFPTIRGGRDTLSLSSG